MTDQPSTPRFRLGFLTHVQGRGDLTTTYRNAQDLFVVADELGFDVGWVAQHHAPLGGGGLPSPWTFLAQPGGLWLQRADRRGTASLGRRVPRALDPAAGAADRPVPVRLPGQGQAVRAGADRGGRCQRLPAAGRTRRVSRRAQHRGLPEPVPLLLRPPGGDRGRTSAGEGAAPGDRPDHAVQPGCSRHDAAIRALELIATEVAPALGWKPAPADSAGPTESAAARRSTAELTGA
jgi:hypothetical protein